MVPNNSSLTSPSVYVPPVPPAQPGQLYFGSCFEGQISSRTNVPSAIQNKQLVIHGCQLTLNFLSIVTTTSTCHRDTSRSFASTPALKHTGTCTHMQAHRKQIRLYLISVLALSHYTLIQMHKRTTRCTNKQGFKKKI